MRLALGTAQFGTRYGIANRSGKVSPAEGGAILSVARSAGIDTLDTAIMYGDSEEMLGKLGVAGWRLITKLPAVPAGCPDVTRWVRDQLRSSAGRLRVDRLDAVLLHRPLQLLEAGGEALAVALLQVRADGLVSKIGVSMYDPAALPELRRRLPIEIVQAPFSVIDRRMHESGWLGRLADSGVEFHARSAFLQGLLLLGATERPARFARWSPLWLRWDGWLRETGLTPAEACLSFVLSFPQVSRVVVGVDSAEQLSALVLAAESAPSAQAPADLRSDDIELIDPSRWAA